MKGVRVRSADLFLAHRADGRRDYGPFDGRAPGNPVSWTPRRVAFAIGGRDTSTAGRAKPQGNKRRGVGIGLAQADFAFYLGALEGE